MKAKIASNVNCNAVVVTAPAEAVLKTVGSVRTVTAKQMLAAMDRWPNLTEKEEITLDELAANRGRITTRADLFDVIYGNEEDGGPESGEKLIDIWVCKVRQKTHANIKTTYGLGYALIPRAESEVSPKIATKTW